MQTTPVADHRSAPPARPGRSVCGAAAAVVVVALALAGCTGGSKALPASTTRSPEPIGTTASSTTSTTSQQQGTDAAIMAGYRAEQAAFYAVVNQYPPNPTDPRLTGTMTGHELASVRNRLTVADLQHQYVVGTADLAPVVTGINGTAATISDCIFDHSRIVDGRTGQTVSGPDTERTLEKATMQLDAGTWKVAGYQKVSVGCHPGDV